MQRYCIANWKLNPITKREATSNFDLIRSGVAKLKKTNVVICPTILHVSLLRERYSGKKVQLGAQDCHAELSGSHTGETSAAQLKDLKIPYVILGHSERRRAGETSDEVARKVRIALSQGLAPIVCFGEPTRDNSGGFYKVIQKQLLDSIAGLSGREISGIILAYEPVWAIGKTANEAVTPRILHETSIYIRSVLTKRYDRHSAFAVSIIYGGSVELGNAGSLIDRTGIEGFLIGHASLDPKEFAGIAQKVEDAELK